MIGSEICAKDTKNVRLVDILFTVFPLGNRYFVVKTRIEKHAFAKGTCTQGFTFCAFEPIYFEENVENNSILTFPKIVTLSQLARDGCVQK